jgi:predicted ester cyclase
VSAAPSLARNILDQTFNQGNLAIVDDLVSVDAVTHIAGWSVPANRLGLKQMIATLRPAFPDLNCAVEDEIADDDRLVALWTMCGTHKGSLFGNLPTGRLVEVQGFLFARAAAGRIVEGWILIEQMSILRQIGIVPPAG